MSLLQALHNIAARRFTGFGAPDAVVADTDAEGELPGMAVIRERLSELAAARQAHRELASQRDQVASEAGALEGRLNVARGSLAAREKQIALESDELPDEVLPEEAEVRRVERQQRILRLRVTEWDRRLAEHAGTIDAIALTVTGAWSDLGSSVNQLLYDQYCAAAVALRDASLLICGFGRCWRSEEPWWKWRFFNLTFKILDPRDGSAILDPIQARYPDKWPEPAASFLRDLQTVKAEIAAAVGKAAVAVGPDLADEGLKGEGGAAKGQGSQE